MNQIQPPPLNLPILLCKESPQLIRNLRPTLRTGSLDLAMKTLRNINGEAFHPP